MDTLCKLARAGRSKTNALRNLMRVINSKNGLLPVSVDCVQITVKKKKPTPRRLRIWWPVLKMSDWIQTLLHTRPEVLLCGFRCEDSRWQRTLSRFWTRFRDTDPCHELFASKPQPAWPFCVPYYIHGDEGRGLRNRALMIEAFQVAISHKGDDHTNECGYLCAALSVLEMP